MSNSLDPGQARHLVGPDLGPNCLQILSADDTSRQRANAGIKFKILNSLLKQEFRLRKSHTCSGLNLLEHER